MRSDRRHFARLQIDLLFRGFVDLPLNEVALDASTYRKNQERLLRREVADLLLAEVVHLAKEQGWVSYDHFSVAGTLIEALASMKSFWPKDEDQRPGSGSSWTNFRGEKRSNDTHASTTDPEAKLGRRGPCKEARLSWAGHSIMENRNVLCVLFEVKPAVGAPESSVAVEQVAELKRPGFNPKTIGADKGYHTKEFVAGVREEGAAPHPARSDRQSTLHVRQTAAHAMSQKLRKRIEEIFGWSRTIRCFRKSRYRRVERTHARGQYLVATWNLVGAGAPPSRARA